MAWPGTKPVGVCNTDGKTVVAGAPAQPCPPPPCLRPKIYCEHPVAYTSQVRTPDDVHVYDVARMPHGQGGMDEAHQSYRIEQSAHWDLRLPRKKTASTGPRGPFYPPTYQPPPNDQRVRDVVSAADQARLAAEEAKRNFEQATGEVRERLKEDNQLKDALREQLETNRKLREQLEGKPKASPSHQGGTCGFEIACQRLGVSKADWEYANNVGGFYSLVGIIGEKLGVPRYDPAVEKGRLEQVTGPMKSPDAGRSKALQKEAELGEDSLSPKEKHETQMSMRHMEGKRTVQEVDRAPYKFVGEKIITYYANKGGYCLVAYDTVNKRASQPLARSSSREEVERIVATMMMPERLLEKRLIEKRERCLCQQRNFSRKRREAKKSSGSFSRRYEAQVIARRHYCGRYDH